MHLEKLLDHENIVDVIITSEKLYIIANGETPDIFSDKQVVKLTPKELLTRKDLQDLLTGSSVRHGPLQKYHHMQRKLLYTYDVSKLSPSEKQTISHTLYGTGGRKSLLESLGGERIGRGAFALPTENKAELEQFFEENKVEWIAKAALIGGSQ